MQIGDQHDRRPFQFSLRGLFLFVLLCAVLLRAYPWLLDWTLKHFSVMVLLTVASFCTFGRFWGRRLQAPHRYVVTQLGLGVSLLALAIMLWAHHRWSVFLDDPLWPRPWPYPDSLLDSVYGRVDNWLDARNPPGLFKCGERGISMVFHILDTLSLIASAACGMFIGIAAARVPLRRLIPR